MKTTNRNCHPGQPSLAQRGTSSRRAHAPRAFRGNKSHPGRTSVFLLTLCLAAPLLARAQAFKIPPDVEKLSSKAKETVEVTMDGPMLRWASKFLSSEDPQEKKVAALVANLKAIYVRSYEFDKDDAYTAAEVESLRDQARVPGWSRVVGVHSDTDGENVDVFFKLENDKMAGIVVISAEPRELTFVHIDGPIEVDQLAELGGEFGVPKIKLKGLHRDNLSKPQKQGGQKPDGKNADGKTKDQQTGDQQ
jgi:Domain of unknown function (DUF4252)